LFEFTVLETNIEKGKTARPCSHDGCGDLGHARNNQLQSGELKTTIAILRFVRFCSCGMPLITRDRLPQRLLGRPCLTRAVSFLPARRASLRMLVSVSASGDKIKHRPHLISRDGRVFLHNLADG
jgi:hypothetical protein